MASANEFETHLTNYVEEVLELRFGVAEDPEGQIVVPNFEEGAAVAQNTLIRVRQRLDRMEELQARTNQIRGRARRRKAAADFEADRAWNEASRANASRQREFVAAKERYADNSLDSFEQKRTAHMADNALAIADEAFEIIKDAVWGMVRLREELLTIIKSDGFERSVERG